MFKKFSGFLFVAIFLGHSLGGYFTLYALIQDMKYGNIFQNYVSASPSIHYHGEYLLNALNSVSSKQNRKLKLFASMGEMEIAGDSGSSFNRLKVILERPDFVEFQSKVYPDLEPMGTAVPSFEDGLKWIFQSEGTKNKKPIPQ